MRGLSAQFSNLSERVGRQRIEVIFNWLVHQFIWKSNIWFDMTSIRDLFVSAHTYQVISNLEKIKGFHCFIVMSLSLKERKNNLTINISLKYVTFYSAVSHVYPFSFAMGLTIRHISHSLTLVVSENNAWHIQEDAGILENIALLLDILQGVKDLVDRREKGVNKEHQQAFNRVSVWACYWLKTCHVTWFIACHWTLHWQIGSEENTV